MQKVTYYFCFIFTLILLNACSNTTKENNNSENIEETSIEEEKKEVITNEEVKELLNAALKAENFIRGYEGEQFEVDVGEGNMIPYIALREGVNTYLLLKEYLLKIYSQKTTEKYLENLDVAINPATDEQIGRIAIYFYNRLYLFDQNDLMQVLSFGGDAKERTYQIMLPRVKWTDEGYPSNEASETIDTLDNFKIILEKGVWKVDELPDNFKNY